MAHPAIMRWLGRYQTTLHLQLGISLLRFRLATNHFNSRSYVNCINICSQLLRKFPTFEEAKKMQGKAEALLKID
jgi:hypothetical protein